MLIVFSLVLALLGILFKIAHRGLINGTLGPDYKLGLRTPATTASKEVWHQAHVAADKEYSLIWKVAFIGAAGLFFIGFFFFTDQELPLWLILLAVFLFIDVIVMYFMARSKADQAAKALLTRAETR